MQQDVANAIDELKRAFPSSVVETVEDGQGGVFFTLNGAEIGTKFEPQCTWFGAHIPAQYPYADIYPVFMDAGVQRADGRPFEVPITPNANFNGRPALQISRRNNHAQAHPQTAVAKILKILDFLERLP